MYSTTPEGLEEVNISSILLLVEKSQERSKRGAIASHVCLQVELIIRLEFNNVVLFL